MNSLLEMARMCDKTPDSKPLSRENSGNDSLDEGKGGSKQTISPNEQTLSKSAKIHKTGKGSKPQGETNHRRTCWRIRVTLVHRGWQR